MKRTSAVTATTLAACIIGIGVGLHDFYRIESLRDAHQALETRAEALGALSASGETTKAGRIRRDEGAEAERIAREIIAAALALPPEARDWSNIEPQWLELGGVEPVPAQDLHHRGQ